MKKLGFFLLSSLVYSSLAPISAHAQGAAPEMFGVSEVIIEYARFDDPKTANGCGLSREEIASALVESFAGTTVPTVAAVEARPPVMGIARIQLIPEISTYMNENFDCISWVSLSAESHANTVIPPINTLRSITAIYWRQHAKVASGQSNHSQQVKALLKKLADQFAQQYRLDQPPVIPK
jgi:hypothetical protein